LNIILLKINQKILHLLYVRETENITDEWFKKQLKTFLRAHTLFSKVPAYTYFYSGKKSCCLFIIRNPRKTKLFKKLYKYYWKNL